MEAFDFDDEFECLECGDKYRISYHESAPEATWCPFCGSESYIHIDEEEDTDADSMAL